MANRTELYKSCKKITAHFIKVVPHTKLIFSWVGKLREMCWVNENSLPGGFESANSLWQMWGQYFTEVYENQWFVPHVSTHVLQWAASKILSVPNSVVCLWGERRPTSLQMFRGKSYLHTLVFWQVYTGTTCKVNMEVVSGPPPPHVHLPT
jgi:hypothetical protein